MAGNFCPYCGSLMSPHSDKCRICGRIDMEDRKQTCLTDMPTRSARMPEILSPDKIEAPFFPYKPRSRQLEIIKDMTDALNDGNHIVVESGTGTGKTIVSLAAALEHASEHHKKLIYLTRTISQSDQVMRELQAISTIRDVSGITVTGRSRSCPLLRTLAGYENMHPSVLANLCEERKSKSNRGSGGCRFYDRMRTNIDDIERFCKNSFPTSEQLDRYCEDRDICPYEAKKMLMKSMNVVIAPYVHILSEDIRVNFLGNMEVDSNSIVLIIDEAHNIVDAAREQESFTISMDLIDAAIDETSTMREPVLFAEVRIKPFLEEFRRSVKSMANEKITLTVKEAIIKPGELEEKLLKKFSFSTSNLDSAIETMIQLGDDRTQLLIDKGDNKISDIYTLGVSIKNWTSSDSDRFIRSVKADDGGESLHAACIDPLNVTDFLSSVKGAIHMSGTLQPLDQYVRTIGLPKGTVTKIYPSPFPPENRSVIYLKNVTTKYDDMKNDPSIFSRMEKNIAKLCNAVEKNTLVFFPSYSMMSKMRPFLERDVKKNAYWEESKQQKKTMVSLDRFRKDGNGVFFTVMGGSIAEGIDFPGDELCFAIIVGIPYPPPTLESKAMSAKFDEKYGYGTGWKYTSEVPALRKMKQAIGRLIRTETDRGMAVIFDYRASKYVAQLDAKLSENPLKDVIEFFEYPNQ